MSYTIKPQENYCICDGCGKKELVSSEEQLPHVWASFKISHVASRQENEVFSVKEKHDLQFCEECKKPLIEAVLSSQQNAESKAKPKGFDTGVTSAELERLAMLAEEASEVIKCACKIIRHGWDSYHPHHPNMSNKQELKREIEDFFAIANYMSHGRNDNLRLLNYIRGRWQQKLPYTHFQEGSTDEE